MGNEITTTYPSSAKKTQPQQRGGVRITNPSANSSGAVWLQAGTHKHDPRDPEVRHEWDRNAQPIDEVEEENLDRPKSTEPAAKPVSKAFVHIGNLNDNRPLEKIEDPKETAKKIAVRQRQFKKKSEKEVSYVRAEVLTDVVQLTDPDGRAAALPQEEDRPDAYFAETLPVMVLEMADVFNKRRLPTPRRGRDINEESEYREAVNRREISRQEFQVQLDSMNLDRVGYQAELEMLSLMTPVKSHVPREDFMATGSGFDELNRDDETYHALMGKLPAGERENLQRIINEY